MAAVALLALPAMAVDMTTDTATASVTLEIFPMCSVSISEDMTAEVHSPTTWQTNDARVTIFCNTTHSVTVVLDKSTLATGQVTANLHDLDGLAGTGKPKGLKQYYINVWGGAGILDEPGVRTGTVTVTVTCNV